MGLFGNDREQDTRLDAIEEWLQGLTGVVQKNHLATSELRIELLKLQSSMDEKLTEGDLAAENWTRLQQGAMEALEELDRELQEAADRNDD
jgi:hypothetical protein